MFDKDKPFDTVCSLPGCKYFQNDKYFSGSGDEVKIDVKDGKTIAIPVKKPAKKAAPKKATTPKPDDAVTVDV